MSKGSLQSPVSHEGVTGTLKSLGDSGELPGHQVLEPESHAWTQGPLSRRAPHLLAPGSCTPILPGAARGLGPPAACALPHCPADRWGPRSHTHHLAHPLVTLTSPSDPTEARASPAHTLRLHLHAACVLAVANLCLHEFLRKEWSEGNSVK